VRQRLMSSFYVFHLHFRRCQPGARASTSVSDEDAAARRECQSRTERDSESLGYNRDRHVSESRLNFLRVRFFVQPSWLIRRSPRTSRSDSMLVFAA
jgi:hypothetical protein